jgi:ABC-type nitrate/sulfonate/bicarbonate transport system substrate-binding protein
MNPVRFVVTAAAVLLALAAGPALAQGPTLKVGLPSLSMFTIVHRIAHDEGFFTREGVQVENNHFESGATNIRALLARSVDVADVETALILGAVGGGADLKVFGTHAQGLHFALYAKKDIKNLQGLYGRTFGISGIGGLPHVVILALLDRQKLDASKVQMLAVGGTGARLKSLAAGKIDATLGEFSPPIEAQPDLHRLMIISQELPLYMSQGLAAWRDTAGAKRDAIERWQRGLVKATRWSYENRGKMVSAARKHLPTGADELLLVHDFYVRARVWAINGEIDAKRLAYMQDLGLKTKTQPKAVDLAALVDASLNERALKGMGRVEYPAQR